MQHEEAAGSPALPLWLEPSPHFGFLRKFLSSSEFNEESICCRVGMAGLMNSFPLTERG